MCGRGILMWSNSQKSKGKGGIPIFLTMRSFVEVIEDLESKDLLSFKVGSFSNFG